MIRQAALVFGLVVSGVAIATGCHQPAHTSPAAIAPDSLKGIVSITGTSFEQRLVLRSGNSVVSLSAVTPESIALARMGGVEVLVIGRATPTVFEVDHFTPSASQAHLSDGVLRNDDGRLVLETTKGRVTLGNPLSALRE